MILGTAIGTSSPYRSELDVIDVGEVSAAGNTIIRAGTRGDNSWQQALHIVLTPTERDKLIGILVEQRAQEARNNDTGGYGG
jgi:hypothetical protein